MRISILLPYKENYSPNYPGAVSLFVYSMFKISKHKSTTYIYGSTNYKKKLSNNYININLSIYTSKYLGLEKSKIVIIGSGVYLLVQIPTLIILTNYWGINGAGFSIVIASIAHAIFFIIISQLQNESKKENKS
mgnify:CR=1 FL=1